MDTHPVQGHPALTDALTGLPNRLHFDTVFEVVFAAGDRGIPVTLLLVEVEEASEALLRDLGPALRGTSRQTDLLARVREDRFALVLLDCNLQGGRLVADRVDGVLAGFRERGLHYAIGGAAYTREMERPGDLVGAAEGALAAAKAAGGDRIEFFQDLGGGGDAGGTDPLRRRFP